jgi:hypothetical protein
VLFGQTPDYQLISQAAAAAFAGARLLHFGLRRRFPVLFSYLVVSSILYAVSSVLSDKSAAYYYLYIVAQPITWVIASLAVREMFALIFRDYPGLQTAGRYALYGALALSVVISLVIAGSFRTAHGAPSSRQVSV